MRRFVLTRQPSVKQGTFGKLELEHILIDFTLEKADGDGKGPIPCGIFNLTIDHSERFGCDMPHILDVPGFEGIRIHTGNKTADTEGCVLLGLNHDEEGIQKSKLAFATFMKRLRLALAEGPVEIEIRGKQAA